MRWAFIATISMTMACGADVGKEETTESATHSCSNSWDVAVTGLTNPRHVRVGPDGNLYVAEAGIGGNMLATCEPVDNFFTQPGPYQAGFTGRISKILPNGQRVTVVDGLPSAHDGFGDSLGVSDIAWIGNTMYAVIEGGGCSRGLPNHPAGIIRVRSNGTFEYVANISQFIRANPVQNEPLCGPEGDCEPDGVPHSLLVEGNRLLVVETNHNSVLRVNPSNGSIQRIYDLSVSDPAPIRLVKRNDDFFLGGFRGTILTFSENFGPVSLFEDGFAPAIADMVFDGSRLYVLETFGPDPDDLFAPNTGQVTLRRSNDSRSVIACGLNFPIGMAKKGNRLYVTNVSFGQGPTPGLGQLVRINL